MAKVFECGAVVPGCKYVAHGEDASDLMINAAEHLRSSHEIENLSDQLKAKIRAAISTVLEPSD